MMEGSTPRQEKRKREDEEEDFQRKESPERKRQKSEMKRQPRKERPRWRRPLQKKAYKPVSFESLYTVGEKLGEGGFGMVFAATRVFDGLQVAVKFVTKQKGDRHMQSPYDSRLIPVEVALMQRMSEPPVKNIIKLIQWFEEPERYILIMERSHSCMDLADFMDRNRGSLSEEQARRIMVQAMEAVIECHKRGVLHRDIKLENFLINTDTLEVKMIDFGCGDWITDCEYNRFIGTMEYCPPEFFLRSSYHATPLTVWSLGVLTFVMVSGFIPFTTRQEIINGRLHFKDHLSDEFCNLIRWCLQANPNRRPNLEQIVQHQWFQGRDPAQEQVMEKDQLSRMLILQRAVNGLWAEASAQYKCNH